MSCFHSYLEPILLIDSVTVAGSSEQVGSVSLNGIAIDGKPADLTLTTVVSKNIERDGQVLKCTTPCGVGSTQGTYVFGVSAPGFKPLEVSVSAKYAVFTGGCPSSNTGGVRVALTLERM